MTTDQGKEFAAFVDAELKAEQDRRASVNTRAGAALTASTALVTLVLAVFAVFVGRDFTLHGWARAFLAIALTFLLLAAICAVVAGTPWTAGVPSPRYLQSLLDDHWQFDEVDARNIAASAKVDAIRILRKGTEKKSQFFPGGQYLSGLRYCRTSLLHPICHLDVQDHIIKSRRSSAAPSRQSNAG